MSHQTSSPSTPFPILTESDNNHDAHVEALHRVQDRLATRLSDERTHRPASPHAKFKDPESIHIRQFVKRGARGGLTGKRTHQAYVLYPVSNAVPIAKHLDYGLILVTRHTSGQQHLEANLALYARTADGHIRCKKDPLLPVATIGMEMFSATTLADFLLTAMTNISTSPMMSAMLESRNMIHEIDRIQVAGRITF